MSEEIRILQLGTEDWNDCYQLPDYVDLTFSENFTKAPKYAYDLVFVDRPIKKEEFKALCRATIVYTLYATDNAVWDDTMQEYYARKKGSRIAAETIQEFLLMEARNYFTNPYGEKFKHKNIAIAQGFTGNVSWNGNYSVVIEGDFGNELNQIVYWRNNIPVFEGQDIELWLEYEKDADIEIALVVTQFVQGSISEVQQQWRFTEKDLEEVVHIDSQMPLGPIFVSLLAKGSGKLSVIALNDRYGRRGHGTFLPGGQRYVASNREEIFYYFDPGDFKPPLAVYFSGFKTLQGFEGVYMMRKMGCPFLLIAEPRLDGGSFYMGSEEYEAALVDIIRNYMGELGFTNDQVILSGLSMGTYGALYYACDIVPHALILGKPLASIGDVAKNERLHRPGGFPTSLDVLQKVSGGSDEEAIRRLNDRFWNKLDATKWNKTKFVLSYMIEDDYDMTAYQTLLSHVKDSGMKVYGKGIHGRHNDETGAIVAWFKNQYEKILEEDFSRKVAN